MASKTTHQELKKRIKKLEKEIVSKSKQIQVSDINIEWNVKRGTCSFENLPVAMMWVDSTLAGLMSGAQSMVGTERFGLALQSEGRKSVEEDWKVISQYSNFQDGFKAIANIAAVAGWGDWEIISLDENKKKCQFRVKNSWEGRYQKSLGICWNSGMLAGKMAGYCSKLFGTNCWAKQTAFIAKGDDFDEFEVEPSERLIEDEIENLLLTDEATRADMAVALQKLRREVNERKIAEKALRNSEKRYRAVAEDMPVLICRFLPDGEITYVNDAYCKYFDKNQEELIGSNFQSLIPEAERKTVMKNLQSLTVEFSTLSHEHPVIAPNANIRWQRWTNRALFDDEGRVFSYQSIGEDITERKLLEEQLRQSQKMDSIGTLAGGIAHDFNNILGIILGNTELVLDDVPELDPVRLRLKEIQTASLHAKDVVLQLMSFARKSKLEKEPIDMATIVRKSLKLLRASIPTSIEIRPNIPKNIDTILADPTQINQILINLCTNANHAMPDGGILEVTLKHVTLDENAAAQYTDLNPGRYVNLIIRDTGLGIPEERIDRIFDPYFTTKEVGKGTGMGLAVVHGIVKEHNGIIILESELGKGTTFSIFFPVVKEEVVVKDETVEILPTGNEKILFVDDNESIVKLERQRLERLGYKVEATLSPIEALELFRSKPDQFDLVITDMTMPSMTGDRLVKEILNIRPDIPIILCTGFSEKMDEKKAKEIGASDYIEKPVERLDFAFKVRKVLDVK